MTADQDILDDLNNPDQPQAWADPRGRVGPSLRERLMSGVRHSGGCWIVTTQPSQKYPLISIRNRMHQRSRVMFFITHGRWPTGGQVRHSCDTPACINPAHLLEGTAQDNSDDMMSRGRNRSPARKSQCLNGHDRTEKNLYPNGTCRTCAIERSKAAYLKRRDG